VGFVVGTLLLSSAGLGDAALSMLIVPILIAVSLPALSRQAAREGDRRVYWFLVAAIFVKVVVGTLIRYYIVFNVYGANDSVQYSKFGAQIAHHFRTGDLATGLHSLTGTNFIRLFTSIVYTIVGPNILTGFFVYS